MTSSLIHRWLTSVQQSASKIAPKCPHLLEFVLLRSPLPHCARVGLCISLLRPGYKDTVASVLLFLSLWDHSLGEVGGNPDAMSREVLWRGPCVEDMRSPPTAGRVSERGGGFSSPAQVLGALAEVLIRTWWEPLSQDHPTKLLSNFCPTEIEQW